MKQEDPFLDYSKNDTDWPTVLTFNDLKTKLPKGYKHFSFAYPVVETRYVSFIAKDIESALKTAHKKIQYTNYQRIGPIKLKGLRLAAAKDYLTSYWSTKPRREYYTNIPIPDSLMPEPANTTINI